MIHFGRRKIWGFRRNFGRQESCRANRWRWIQIFGSRDKIRAQWRSWLPNPNLKIKMTKIEHKLTKIQFRNSKFHPKSPKFDSDAKNSNQNPMPKIQTKIFWIREKKNLSILIKKSKIFSLRSKIFDFLIKIVKFFFSRIQKIRTRYYCRAGWF